MLTSISSLIDGDKISYEIVEEMIDSGAIKNIFTKIDSGKFKKVENIKEMECMFLAYYNEQILDCKKRVEDNKNDLKRAMQKYNDDYSRLKSQYKLKWYNPDEIIEESCKALKKMLKDDVYNHKNKIYYLRDEKRRFKNEAAKLLADKKRWMYYHLYIYSHEYEKAKGEYIKKVLENNQ